MRNLTRLPFSDDLAAFFAERVAEYTGGRKTLTDQEVGEVAWGVSTLWEGFTGARELAGVDYLARPELLQAYLLYYVPRSYVQARLVFRHLEAGRIHRVLDLGSGPGPLLRAAVDAFGAGQGQLELVAVDHDARALEAAKRVVGRQVRSAVCKLPAVPSSLGEGFDLVTLGLVVNELFAGEPDATQRRVRWLEAEIWPRVTTGGYLVIIEPALRETGREALVLRDQLVARGMRVIAPCLRQGGCPALVKERDWCHAGLRFQPPAALQAVGRGVGIDATDLRFTYLVFQKGEAVVPAPTPGERFRVVSDPMVEKGRLKLWVCGERGRVLLDRQDKHRTDANAAMDDLVRDAVVTIEHAEEKAESLRVVAETRVTPVPQPPTIV